MSVIRCKLIGGGRDGSRDVKGIEVYTQLWRVETNDPLDGPQVVVNHTELPELFSQYTSGNDSKSTALLVSKKPREEGDSRVSWIVTCEYRTDAIGQEYASSPLNDPPKFSTNFDQFSTIARQCYDNGQRLINSVDQVFTPPPEVDQSRMVYTVRKNESYLNLPLWIDMIDSVNQQAWKGCAPRTVKCKSIVGGEVETRNGVDFIPVTYEFHLNDLTWDLRVLNQGTRHFDVALGQYINLAPGAEPVTLYVKNSAIVPRGATVSQDASFYEEKASAASDVVYLRYKYYKTRNFGLFNF